MVHVHGIYSAYGLGGTTAGARGGDMHYIYHAWEARQLERGDDMREVEGGGCHSVEPGIYSPVEAEADFVTPSHGDSNTGDSVAPFETPHDTIPASAPKQSGIFP